MTAKISLRYLFHQFLFLVCLPFQSMNPTPFILPLTYILFPPNADKQHCEKSFLVESKTFSSNFVFKANLFQKRSSGPWDLGYIWMTVIICSLDFPEFWFGFIMIGEWCCQWSLLPVSSHPVIWINLPLIGAQQNIKMRRNKSISCPTKPRSREERSPRDERESRRLNHFAGASFLQPTTAAAVIAPYLPTYLQPSP